MGLRTRGTIGEYRTTSAAGEAAALRACQERVLRLLVEEGGNEAARRLPDETSTEWTPDALRVVGCVLGGPTLASDPLLSAFGEELAMAANAVAIRWCRGPLLSERRCEDVQVQTPRGLLINRGSGCPLAGECVAGGTLRP